MIPLPKKSTVAWIAGVMGLGVGVYTAFISGGQVAALGSGSAALLGIAGMLGWQSRGPLG